MDIKRIVAAIGVLLVFFHCAASGSVISFNLNYEFSGAAPPAGAPPWLNVTFDDDDSVGSVTATLMALNLTGDEFIAAWMFNLDPDMNPADLQFPTLIKTGTFNDPGISTKVDSYKADGDGKFDIKIEFALSGGPNAHFGPGEAIEYTITAAGLTAGSFDFPSKSMGGKGVFRTVAHIQGIGEDSGWVSVPEPGTLVLLGLGAMGLLRRKRGYGA